MTAPFRLSSLPTVVTFHDATLVLAFIGSPGFPPTLLSGFTKPLLEALSRADRSNRALLGKGFPGLAAAWSAYSDTENGEELLREKALS